MWSVEHSSVPLFPQSPSSDNDQSIETAPLGVPELAPHLNPPFQEWVMWLRPTSLNVELLETQVPTLSCMYALGQDAVKIIFFLQADEAWRRVVL